MRKFDIVIIGSGAAGMMAAWKAAKAGFACAVLEKGRHIASSNAARCGGPALADTRLQQEENATVTREQLFSHMYEFSRGTVHAGLLRNAIGKGRETETVLQEAGIEMILLEDTYGVGFRARHFFRTPVNKRWQMLEKLLESLGVQFYFQMEAEHIIQDNAGNIKGILARNLAEDKEEEFYSKGVIIAGGGYLGNKDMIREHFGDIHVGTLGSRLSDGAGIRIALEAGGVLDRNWGICSNEFGGYHSNMKKGISSNMYFAIGGGLLVDRNGRRFMNEQRMSDEPLSLGGESTLREGHYYAVLDDDYYHALEKGSLYDYYGKPDDWHAGKTVHSVAKNPRPEDLEKDIEGGYAAKADNLGELAKRFQLFYLEQTVKEYNAMCNQRCDALFGKSEYLLKPVKKAPFYIFEYEPSAWCTIGGVKTDEFCRALTPLGQVIEGLYVAGMDNGSCYSVPYYDNEGSAAGLAFTTGLVAGEHMAEYLKEGAYKGERLNIF